VTPFLGGRVALHQGDSREMMRGLPDASIDACVTDPPYGLGFMGRPWDTGETAFDRLFWQEVLRVLKPGGHLVAFSGTRTYHRLACAIEDAGVEVRDMISWLYGSGFPKNLDVPTALDKIDGLAPRRERALRFTAWLRSTGITARVINAATQSNMASHYLTDGAQPEVATREMFEKLRPSLPQVIPAWVEQLIDARELESANLARREVIGQHAKEAHAASWRAGHEGGEVNRPAAITRAFSSEAQAWEGWGTALKPACEPIVLARKPLIGTVAENVRAFGTAALNIDGCRVGTELRSRSRSRSTGQLISENGSMAGGNYAREIVGEVEGRWPANVVHDGSDEVLAAFDAFGAPPTGFDDSGSAARFFYSAKADADDRIGSAHPTVKPVALMRWLCRLVTPPGGTVLDPFAGTGTTGEAAFREGFAAVLIEREPAYCADIARRMALAEAGPATRRAESAKARGRKAEPLPLFGDEGDPGGGGGRSTGHSLATGDRADRIEAVRHT